jgi:hypothetical protein
MKNFGKLVGIIAVVAVIGLLAGCGDKGGILVVKNDTGDDISIVLIGGIIQDDTIPNGKSGEYSTLIDSDVTITATGKNISLALQKKVRLEGGETVTATVTKTIIK